MTLALILGHWDVQAEVYLGFFLCLGQVYLLHRLACATSGFKRCDRAFLVFVFSWLLWSPMTWYFHTWSITFERLLPEAALLGGVLWSLLRHSISTLQALGFSALAATGQYSFSGGVALYPLFGLLLLSDAVSWRTLKPLLTYGALASLSMALYFAGYRHPAGHTPLLAVLDQPLTSVFGFFLTVLGRSFSEEPHLAVCMGGINLGLYALGTVRAWQVDWRDRTAWAWMLIGGYALMQALLATIGRLPMGMGHALRPDYITYGTYLLVAGIAFRHRDDWDSVCPHFRLRTDAHLPLPPARREKLPTEARFSWGVLPTHPLPAPRTSPVEGKNGFQTRRTRIPLNQRPNSSQRRLCGVAQAVGRNFAFAGWSGVLPVSVQEIGALRAYAFSANKGFLVPINWLRPDPPSPTQ